LRQRTQDLHRTAERSGLVADLLRGRASLRDYRLFLRNLLAAYEALEAGLERHRRTPGVQDFARPEVYRSGAIIADMAALAGEGWREDLPLLPAAKAYALSIEAAAEGAGVGLIGHAYVRYLGDLSGGQVLKRQLAKSLDLPPSALTFYDFPRIADMDLYKRSYREALDQLVEVDADAVIKGALDAFSLNIQLSDAVRTAGLAAADSPP
jgi:heme oxygenase